MNVDELAAALRAYVGPPRSPDTVGAQRWYLDFDSSATDEEIRAIAEDIIERWSAVGSAVSPTDPES